MDVATIMSREPITVSPDLSVCEARTLLENEDIRHAPVVRDGQLVGVISDRDLNPTEDELFAAEVLREDAPPRTIADVMHRQVTTVTPEDTVVTAAVDFSMEKIGCLPVVDEDGVFVGLLTETDLLRAAIVATPESGYAAEPIEAQAEDEEEDLP